MEDRRYMEEIKIAIRVVTVILGIYLYSWVWEYLKNSENEYLFCKWILINAFIVILIIFWAFS